MTNKSDAKAIKSKLIKIGEDHPELQPDLEQIIDEVEKEAGGFSITERGLERPKKILMQPNTVYYYGASSDPERVVTESVTDEDVIFYRLPYGEKPRKTREQRWIFEDLAYNGTSTWVNTYGSYFPYDAKDLKMLLQGKPVRELNLGAFLKGEETITVKVVGTHPDVDTYGRAKSYGIIHGMEEETGFATISIQRKRLEDIKRDHLIDLVK